ncbi:MAG: hypothetical protein WC789_14255 [Lentisphaeria bacterium]
MKILKTALVFVLLACLLPACDPTEREEDLLLATCGEVSDLLADSMGRLCDPMVCAHGGVLFVRDPQICQVTMTVRQEFGYERIALSLWHDDLVECVGREALCAGAMLVAIDRSYPLLVGPVAERMLLDPEGGW